MNGSDFCTYLRFCFRYECKCPENVCRVVSVDTYMYILCIRSDRCETFCATDARDWFAKCAIQACSTCLECAGESFKHATLFRACLGSIFKQDIVIAL